MDDFRILVGNMLEQLDTLSPECVDNIVTDPPYELNFMGKGWDNAGVSFNAETWKKCLRVLKPGGYLLAFGGSRTYHRIACAIEDAGFEIRDTIMWLYGSGFPKSMNISLALEKRAENANVTSDKKLCEQWDGWGTCLKPAFEPIIVARKPVTTSLIDNVIVNGVGAFNIDECRIPFNGDKWEPQKSGATSRAYQSEETTTAGGVCEANDKGRFPANVILTYNDSDYDEVCGGFPYTKSVGGSGVASTSNTFGNVYGEYNHDYISSSLGGFHDEGSASRYYYCAKASAKDRNEGLENFEDKVKVFNGKSNNSSKDIKDVEKRFTTVMKNTHPTVKPTELMQYLVRLVAPKGSTVLDPFMGSGSTGKAVMFENRERNANYKFIGVELSPEYAEIAKARILFAKGFKLEKVSTDTNEVVITKQAHTNRLF